MKAQSTLIERLPRARKQTDPTSDTLPMGRSFGTYSLGIQGDLIVQFSGNVGLPHYDSLYISSEPRNVSPLEVVLSYPDPKDGSTAPELQTWDHSMASPTAPSFSKPLSNYEGYFRDVTCTANLQSYQCLTFRSYYNSSAKCNQFYLYNPSTLKWDLICSSQSIASAPVAPPASTPSGWAIFEYKRLIGKPPTSPWGVVDGVQGVMNIQLMNAAGNWFTPQADDVSVWQMTAPQAAGFYEPFFPASPSNFTCMTIPEVVNVSAGAGAIGALGSYNLATPLEIFGAYYVLLQGGASQSSYAIYELNGDGSLGSQTDTGDLGVHFQYLAGYHAAGTPYLFGYYNLRGQLWRNWVLEDGGKLGAVQNYGSDLNYDDPLGCVEFEGDAYLAAIRASGGTYSLGAHALAAGGVGSLTGSLSLSSYYSLLCSYHVGINAYVFLYNSTDDAYQVLRFTDEASHRFVQVDSGTLAGAYYNVTPMTMDGVPFLMLERQTDLGAVSRDFFEVLPSGTINTTPRLSAPIPSLFQSLSYPASSSNSTNVFGFISSGSNWAIDQYNVQVSVPAAPGR